MLIAEGKCIIAVEAVIIAYSFAKIKKKKCSEHRNMLVAYTGMGARIAQKPERYAYR